MALIALHCTPQSRTPNIDRCVPENLPWPFTWPLTLTSTLKAGPVTLTLKQLNNDVKTRFLAFDLDLWPTTLIYNPNLAKVKVNLHTEFQGHRSNSSAVRGGTEGQMDATKYIFSYSLRLIMATGHCKCNFETLYISTCGYFDNFCVDRLANYWFIYSDKLVRDVS